MNTSISFRIKYLREQHSISQQELANSIGVSLRTIQRYEAGCVKRPSNTVIQLIANSLGVSIEYLLEGDNQQSVSDVGITLRSVLNSLENDIILLDGHVLTSEAKEVLVNAVRVGIIVAKEKNK